MKRPLNVFPIGGEEPTDWVAGWNDTHPDTPLQIVDAPEQCQAYLACDLAADVIDAELQDKHLPDRPVIWPPYVYNSCGDFMQENSTCYDQLLRTIYGVVTRDSLLATLREAKTVLDDASSVVDAGEGEEYAYEHDLRHLEKLIERLEGGVFIVEEEVNHLEIELAESDDEAADDEEAGDDLCDNCFAAGVACDQTCACGKTLCADCAAENDGRCGGCAAKADEEESDDDDADDDQSL